jgi:hypothetical protein
MLLEIAAIVCLYTARAAHGGIGLQSCRVRHP